MLKVKYNHIPNLIRRFRELDKAKFSIGYYQENGTHPSSLTYATLFAIHEYGAPSVGIPSRPALTQNFSMWNPLDKNLLLKKQLKLYFSNIKLKSPKVSLSTMLSVVAGDYVMSTRDVFGSTSLLASNSAFTQYIKAKSGKVPDSPLIWSGNLRDNLSYRINNQPIVTP